MNDFIEYTNRKLLLCNFECNGLLFTAGGSNILVELDRSGMVTFSEITDTFGMSPVQKMSLQLFGEQYLRIPDLSVDAVLKHLILPEMEVERIFNSQRHKYLTAIFLSDFVNPQQYMNARYNKAFEALAGIEVTQPDDHQKKDNDCFWKVAGFSPTAKELNWGKDFEDLERILGILRMPGLGFDYPSLYNELIAIKPGFHELMIHHDYFDKPQAGDSLRDNVFRSLRGSDCSENNGITSLPDDMEANSYNRYAPCHVTEGPFVARRDLHVSYFSEIKKINSKEKLASIANKFRVFDYFHESIDSTLKLEKLLENSQHFTKY